MVRSKVNEKRHHDRVLARHLFLSGKSVKDITVEIGRCPNFVTKWGPNFPGTYQDRKRSGRPLKIDRQLGARIVRKLGPTAKTTSSPALLAEKFHAEGKDGPKRSVTFLAT